MKEVKTPIASSANEKRSYAEEKRLILSKMPDVETVSIYFISTTTSIPEERVIEILSDDPNYFIEKPFIIQRKNMTNDELNSKRDIIRILISGEKGQIRKSCPECKSVYLQGTKYCPACGMQLE